MMTGVVEPINGGISYGTPWTGGKPKPDRTDCERTSPLTPFGYRQAGEKFYKNYQKLTTGRILKLKRNDPSDTLTNFSDDAARHMERTGMDSVFYFTDPSDNDKMLNLFESHMHFTAAEISKQVTTMKANNTYDPYDIDNLNNSRSWLEDSLDSDLWNSLRSQVDRDLSGPELYMVLVSEVQSDSIQSMRTKEHKLQALKLKDYPGENVRDLNNDILVLCNTLFNNKTLPIDTILCIVDKYTAASSEDFRVHFMTRRAAVESFMRATAGKDAAVIAAMPDPITYRSITAEASTKYQSLLDTDKWPSAATANDRGGAPDILAHMAKLESKVDAVLLQKQTRGNGPVDMAKITCHNCGQPGHYKNDCPKSSSAGWQRTAPAAGEPESKQVGPRLFHWCATCNRWSTTHATVEKGNVKGHTGKSSAVAPAAPVPGVPVPGAPVPSPGPEANACAPSSLLGNFGAW
jgi:hypothetical protein